MGALHILHKPHPLALLYSGNLRNGQVQKLQVVIQWTQMGKLMVQSWSNSDSGSACPVLCFSYEECLEFTIAQLFHDWSSWSRAVKPLAKSSFKTAAMWLTLPALYYEHAGDLNTNICKLGMWNMVALSLRIYAFFPAYCYCLLVDKFNCYPFVQLLHCY